MGTVIVFIVATILYVAMMTSVSDLPRGDAAGRGLAIGYAVISGLGLWLALAVMLLLAFIGGPMPRWTGAAMLILLPLAGIAAVFAGALYAETGGWPILAPALLPPIVALYALALRFPAFGAPPASTSAAVVAIVTLLSIVPLVVSYVRAHPGAAEQARRQEAAQAQQAAREREAKEAIEREIAAFNKLGPASSLRDYLDYLAPGDSRFDEAVRGARQVVSRHGDAIALLREGRIDGLQELWRLDLTPTPDLCTAYGAALGAEAAKVQRGRGAYLAVAMDLERQLPNIRWLAGARCDLGQALTTLETNLRAADSERLTKFADTVASFRKPR